MRHFFKIVCCVLGLSLSQVVAQSLAHPPVESRLDYRHSSGAIHYSNTGWFLSWNPLIAKQFSSQWLAWATPLSGHYLLSEKISHHHWSSEYSISPGIGARYLLMPQWALGFHFVHDRAFFKTTSDAHSPRSRGINIVGIENLWPFAKADVHLYYQYQQGWGWDSSCSIPLSHHFSVLVGGYYQSDHLGHLATKKIAPSTPRIGFAVGAQYHLSPAWDIKVQYSHNNYNEYDWSIKLQKRVGARSTNTHALLHQPIERNYVHPLLLYNRPSTARLDPYVFADIVCGAARQFQKNTRAAGEELFENLATGIEMDEETREHLVEQCITICKHMHSNRRLPEQHLDFNLFAKMLLNSGIISYTDGPGRTERIKIYRRVVGACKLRKDIIDPYFTQQELAAFEEKNWFWVNNLTTPNDTNYLIRRPILEPHNISLKSDRPSNLFDQLPAELLENILGDLTLTERLQLACTHKRLYLYMLDSIKRHLTHSYRTENVVTLSSLVGEMQLNPFVIQPSFLEQYDFNSLIFEKEILEKKFNKKAKKKNITRKKVVSEEIALQYRWRYRWNIDNPDVDIDDQLITLIICYFPEFYRALDCSNINTLSQLTALNYAYYSQSNSISQPHYSCDSTYQPINIASLIFRNPALYAPILGMPDSRYPLYYLSMMALNSPPQVIMQELRYDPTVFNFIKEKYGALSLEEQATFFPSEAIRTSLNLLITFLAAVDQLEKEPTGLTLNQLVENSQKTRTSLPRWNYPESLERVAVRELCSWMLSWMEPYSLEEFQKSL